MSFLAIFLASIFGSLHCVGMCGGFVAMAANRPNSALSLSSYHFGRLLVYALLGGLVGAMGNSLNQLGVLAGVSSLAPILTGIVLAWWGLLALRSGTLPAPSGKLWKLSLSFLNKSPDGTLPFFLGCFSAFMPCGWLYVFLATAATFGSPVEGALAMTVFWIGTVPALTALGAATKLSIAKSGFSPTIVALCLIFAGLFSIGAHVQSTLAQQSHSSCHQE